MPHGVLWRVSVLPFHPLPNTKDPTMRDAIRCLGRKADGTLCRTLTRQTVQVAGRHHAACAHHAEQVRDTMLAAEQSRVAAQ